MIAKKFRFISLVFLVITVYLVILSIYKLDHIKYITSSIIGSRKNTILKSTDIINKIDQKLPHIYKENLKNDAENVYWMLNSDLSQYNTKVNIPSYYYGENDFQRNLRSKMIVQPFDPRFTMGIYISHLQRQLDGSGGDDSKDIEVPFHWSDWVDLSALNKYLLLPVDEKPGCGILQYVGSSSKREDKVETLPVDEFCFDTEKMSTEDINDDLFKLGFNVFSTPGRSTADIIRSSGKSFLYSYAPNPENIIFLSKHGSYKLKPKTKQNLIKSDLVDQYITSAKKDNNRYQIDSLSEFKNLLHKNPPQNEYKISDMEVIIPEESFQFSYDDKIEYFESKLNSNGKLSSSDSNYYKTLKYSKAICENDGPPKYFQEARLIDSEPGAIYGDHYDWRFFNGVIVGSKEQELVLHRLVRSWILFCSNHGFKSWIAHGSLLSWYWNGIAFPWDNDIDVQMPIYDLHKLSQMYNQSLIIEDLEDGFGKYYLDCGTFITQRVKGNGNNNIDARFIDVDTGLYVDITGLALTDSQPPDRYNYLLSKAIKKEGTNLQKAMELQVYNCRNNHYLRHQELSPLFKTSVEGQMAYIPKSFEKILTNEYSPKSLTDKQYSDYYFIDELRLWINENLLKDYIKDKPLWVAENNPSKLLENPGGLPANDLKSIEKRLMDDNQKSSVSKFKLDDFTNLLYKDAIFLEFYNMRDFTKFRREEKIKLSMRESTTELIEHENNGVFKPMRIDLFLYLLSKFNGNYDEEVEKLIELQNN